MNSVWPKWSSGENGSFFWFVRCYTVFLLHYLFVITDILWMISVKRRPLFSRSWEFPSRLFPDPTSPLTQQLEALNYDQVHVLLCLSAHCNLRILCHLCQFQLQVPSMQMSRSPIENDTIIFNKFIQYLESEKLLPGSWQLQIVWSNHHVELECWACDLQWGTLSGTWCQLRSHPLIDFTEKFFCLALTNSQLHAARPKIHLPDFLSLCITYGHNTIHDTPRSYEFQGHHVNQLLHCRVDIQQLLFH